MLGHNVLCTELYFHEGGMSPNYFQVSTVTNDPYDYYHKYALKPCSYRLEHRIHYTHPLSVSCTT